MKEFQDVIQKTVHEVLDKYLAGKLLFTVESEVTANLMWELVNNFNIEVDIKEEDND